MTMIPNLITHNYDPVRGMARNICGLPPDQAEVILDDIRASGKRRIKPNYLERRNRTEDWLIAQRRRALGETALRRPIYFFLGDFADGQDRSRPASLVMALDALPPEVLTFTYPDSMASLALASKDEHQHVRQPYHGRVFTLPEIAAVVAHFGLPEKGSVAGAKTGAETYVEVQVWDDAPIKQFLAAA